MKYINEVTREKGIEHHSLRSWEDKGFLGTVQRDFTHGRMYDEEQIKRIERIQEVVLKQQKKGMKRTDFKEVDRVLTEEFGGIMTVREPNIPATPETFTNMLLKFEKQDKQIQELQQMVLELTKITKELPTPVDQSAEIQSIKELTQGLISKLAEDEKEKEKKKENAKKEAAEIQKIKEQTEGIMTKDQAEMLISRLVEEEKEKEEARKEMELLKSKLDTAVEYILDQEKEKTEKKGIWKRIFG